MIGVILLKDTSNGSYRYIRITAYHGKYYSDMDIDKPYMSYTIDTVNRSITDKVFDKSKEPPYFRLTLIYKVYDEARKYLLNNPLVTQLLFKCDGSSVEFKPNSYVPGISTVPDYINQYVRTGTYFLCGGTKNQPKRSILFNDVFCNLANYAVDNFLKISNKIYYPTGGSVYIDVGIMFNRISSRLAFKKALSEYGGAYKLLCKLHNKHLCTKTVGQLPLLLNKKKIPDFQYCTSDEPRAKLIELYRKSYTEAYCAVLKYKNFRVFNSNAAKGLINLCFDKTLLEITDKCCTEFCRYGEKLRKWGYYPEEFNFDYITSNELLLSEFGSEEIDRIAKLCSRRGKIYRLQSKLPAPLVISCFGECFFDFG